MFGIFRENQLAGIVVLNETQSPEYSAIDWELDDRTPLVMHRFCVHPKFQKQGIAKQLLTLAERFAIDSQYKSIRLDAFTENPAALNLYANNSYVKRGTVTFRKGDLYCYEKMV